MLNTSEALKYLQDKHPNLQLSLDTFYHAIHRRNFQRSQVVSKHDPDKLLHRYLFTEEQLDSLNFRAITRQRTKPLPERNIVTVYTSNDIHEIEKDHGLLLTVDGVLAEIYAVTNVMYNKNNVRNMQRTGALPPVARIGYSYLYRARDLKNIKLNPGRIKKIDTEMQSVL
jgi:hypothetical protein